MRCIICDSPASYYFSKTYTQEPYATFMADIGHVDYHRCVHCGFTCSKTHRELDRSRWERLNHQFHEYLEDLALNERLINQPPYAEQALMLSILARHGLIDSDDMLDYAGGRGTLSDILSRYFGMRLPIFDPYISSSEKGDYIRSDELRSYRTVINSAMFEHVLEREDLDAVNRLVKPDGSLIIHTVIAEHVPKDPEWFYLAPPVHTAFHTNKSMGLLMEQWGYEASIYSPKSKCWVLLREDESETARCVESINQRLQSAWFHYKRGFMDYWK